MSEMKKAQPSAVQPVNLYQLKVALNHTKPVIWRRLRVPGDIKLALLHAAIQVAMGWMNSHLHQFIIKKVFYSDPSFGLNDRSFGGPAILDERKAALMELVPAEKESFVYEYDFGDSWEHRITVEKILPPDPSMRTSCECLGGKRACPPEDCGGVWGYEHLLEVIKNPKDEEHDSMMQWLGGGFNPGAFDLEKTNFYLRKLKWPGVTVDQLAKVLMQRDNYKG